MGWSESSSSDDSLLLSSWGVSFNPSKAKSMIWVGLEVSSLIEPRDLRPSDFKNYDNASSSASSLIDIIRPYEKIDL